MIEPNIKIIVIGGSAGSFKITHEILSELPYSFKHIIIVCLHRWRENTKEFTKTISGRLNKQAIELQDKMQLEAGGIYVVPANYHCYITNQFKTILTNEEEVCFSRPSINITMESVAKSFKEKAIAILLSGANNDGAEGIAEIIKQGGKALIQDPKECEVDIMPNEALVFNSLSEVFSKNDIKKLINKLD